MILKAIADHIAANIPGMVFGTNVFVNQAPAGEELTVLLRDNPGGFKRDGEMETERRGTFQLVTRGPSYVEAYDKAVEISQLLLTDNLELTGYVIKQSRPQHEPISYQTSVANLSEISVNFVLSYGIV